METSAWRRPILTGIGWGLGTALGLAILFGGFLWYQSRPKPWNTSAIVSTAAPSFNSSADYKYFQLSYDMENRTATDYQITSDGGLKMMMRNTEGVLSPPFLDGSERLTLPIFIPAKQKGYLRVSVALNGEIPERGSSETDEQYHERLRAFCGDKFARIGTLVVFDEVNRYQIELPKCRTEPLKASR